MDEYIKYEGYIIKELLNRGRKNYFLNPNKVWDKVCELTPNNMLLGRKDKAKQIFLDLFSK